MGSASCVLLVNSRPSTCGRRQGAGAVDHDRQASVFSLVALASLAVSDEPKDAKWFILDSTVAVSSVLHGWVNAILKHHIEERGLTLTAVTVTYCRCHECFAPNLAQPAVDAPRNPKGYLYSAAMTVCLVIMTWVVALLYTYRQRVWPHSSGPCLLLEVPAYVDSGDKHREEKPASEQAVAFTLTGSTEKAEGEEQSATKSTGGAGEIGIIAPAACPSHQKSNHQCPVDCSLCSYYALCSCLVTVLEDTFEYPALLAAMAWVSRDKLSLTVQTWTFSSSSMILRSLQRRLP